MTEAEQQRYRNWLDRLQQLAQAEGIAWIVQPASGAHAEAFLQGLQPEEECAALRDMAAWRGCGCGGG